MHQGSFGFNEIGTVSVPTGGALFTLSGMISHIVVIVTLVAFVTEVGFAKQSAKELQPS